MAVSRVSTLHLNFLATGWKRAWKRRVFRRRIVRYSLVSINVALLAGVISFVVINSRATQAAGSLTLAQTNAADTVATNPLDQLSSADIAESVADLVQLPEATAVRNQADTENAELGVMTADSTVAAKTQVVSTALKSRSDIATYVVQPGDTLASLAARFGVSANSIQWSNSLSGTALSPGLKLTIPPITGIVYTVKPGNTPQSLATTYQASAAQIISFNDAELSGLQTGEQIVIPNGQVQAPQPSSSYSNYAAAYGSFGTCIHDGKAYPNYGYDCGYCTWWAAFSRAQAGDPVPSNLGEASSWAYIARDEGMSVGNTPQPGAVIVFNDDHVAYVQAVNADGSITISEMNHAGWNIVDQRIIPASQAAGYSYIY